MSANFSAYAAIMHFKNVDLSAKLRLWTSFLRYLTHKFCHVRAPLSASRRDTEIKNFLPRFNSFLKCIYKPQIIALLENRVQFSFMLLNMGPFIPVKVMVLRSTHRPTTEAQSDKWSCSHQIIILQLVNKVKNNCNRRSVVHYNAI